jgi:Flp pilus assembly protein CpaB
VRILRNRNGSMDDFQLSTLPTQESHMKRLSIYAAVGAAVAGFGMLEAYKLRFERAVTGGEMVEVVSLGRNVAIGHRLTEGDVETQIVPARFIDRRRVRARDVRDIIGVHTSGGLSAGDALLYDDLALGRADQRSLSLLVPDGYRAVTVAADAFQGLLRPGDRVDVLLTPEAVEGARAKARMVLQGALVLAVGGSTAAETTRAASGSVVLATTLDEAALLAPALGAGHVTLALRNPGDLATTAAGAARDATEGATGVR